MGLQIDKLKVADKLLKEANESFDKSHFSKVDKARSIIKNIIKESENNVRTRNKSE